MDNIISSYIDKYFDVLKTVGYLNYPTVDTLLSVIFINDLTTNIDYE